MIARIVVALALVVVAAAGGWWFVTNFERATVEEWVGPASEARRNPLLALERMLTAMGLETRAARSISDLARLPPGGVLILGSRRQGIATRERQRILAWIAAGGLAIIDAEWPQEPDPLFDDLAIDRASDEFSNRDVSEVALPGLDQKLRAELGGIGTLALYDGTALFEAGDHTGTKLIGLNYGRGRVAAFISFDLFTNRAIGREDHARLVWELVRWHARETANAAPAVMIFNQPGKLSLWQWLVEHARYLLVALAALVIAWLWRVAIRFGPLEPEAAPAERRMIDHVAAAGRFEWRHGGAARLAAASHASALGRLQRIEPELAGAPPERAAEIIAPATGLSVAQAMRITRDTQAPTTAHDFLDRVTLHQRIHHAVARRLAARRRRDAS